MTIRLTPFVLCLALFSCTENGTSEASFYLTTTAAHDVARLPLVYPYQLITAYCCEGWNSGPGSTLHRDFGFANSVDSVNIQKGFILIHTKDSGSPWIALDIQTKQRTNLEDIQALQLFSNEHGFVPRLISTRIAFEEWLDTGQLPWANQIPAQS